MAPIRPTSGYEGEHMLTYSSVKDRPSPLTQDNAGSLTDVDVAPNPPISRKKLPKTVPWFHFPQSQQQIDEARSRGQEVGGSAWFTKEQEASEWLNLFYGVLIDIRRNLLQDLAVVAVLSVFSTKHELSKASVLPNFVS